MKPRIYQAIFLFCALLLLTNPLPGQALDQNLQALLTKAELVVEGEVGSFSTYEEPATGLIYTTYQLSVSHLFAGAPFRPEQLQVRVLGGAFEDRAVQVSHGAKLSVGERGIFLLRSVPGKTETYELFGGQAGKITRVENSYRSEGYVWGTGEQVSSWRQLRERIGRLFGQDLRPTPLTTEEAIAAAAPSTEFCVQITNPRPLFESSQLAFDVYVKSNVAGLAFSGAAIELEYPAEELGINLVANESVEAEKGVVIQDEGYTLGLADVSSSSFQLLVQTACGPFTNYYTLSTEYEKMATVLMDVENWEELTSIQSDNFAYEGAAYYYRGRGICAPFDELCANTGVQLTTCNISSVETAPFAAGRGQILTIKGTNFGNGISGEVEAPNADNDGNTPFTFAGTDIILDPDLIWNDTMIQVKLLSTNSYTGVGGGMHEAPMGSGEWTVKPNGTSSMSCQTTIEIDYALVNNPSNDLMLGLFRNPFVIPDSTFEWYLDGDIDTDPALMAQGITFDMVKNVAEDAFCDWEKVTGIDFKYMGKLPGATQGADNKFVLMFDPLGAGSSGGQTLANTTNYISTTTSSDCPAFGGYVLESDIQFDNSSTDWFVSTNSVGIGSTEYDLYSVMIHEIGHALLLDHAMDPDPSNGTSDARIMYWSLEPKQIKRGIDGDAVSGVDYLLDTTFAEMMPGDCFVGFGLRTGSSACISSTHNHVAREYCQLEAFTNLLSSGSRLRIPVQPFPVEWMQLVDASGRVMEVVRPAFGQLDVEFRTDHLPPGLYFLQYECDYGLVTEKLVIH